MSFLFVLLVLAASATTIVSGDSLVSNDVAPIIRIPMFMQSSGSSCDGGAACQCKTTLESSSLLPAAAAAMPLTLSISGACDTDVGCGSFAAFLQQPIADLTAVAQQHSGRSLNVSCYTRLNANECYMVAVSQLKSIPAADGKGGYWPAPYSTNCSSKTSDSKCTGTQVIDTFSCYSGRDPCYVAVPLTAPKKGEGFLLSLTSGCTVFDDACDANDPTTSFTAFCTFTI